MNSMKLKDKLKNTSKEKMQILIHYLDFICMIDL